MHVCMVIIVFPCRVFQIRFEMNDWLRGLDAEARAPLRLKPPTSDDIMTLLEFSKIPSAEKSKAAAYPWLK